MQDQNYQVVPTKDDYVLQANAISRAAYTMPVVARRLIYLAMAQVRPEDDDFMDTTMQVGDVVRALGLSDGAENYQAIRDAARTCAKWIIEIEQPDGGWQLYGWLSYASYDPKTDTITLRLNDPLRPYILNLQAAYSIIPIADIAKIQSRHALRWYELVMSRRGQADKSGRWWVEYSIAELRRLLKIGPNEYTRTSNLRAFVIELPLQEINEAQIGLYLEPEYIRKGKYLHGVRIHCQLVKRGDPVPVQRQRQEEESEEAYIAAHRERYEAILADIRAQPELPGTGWASPAMREMAQRAEALKRLREETGKRGRGRPRKEGR